MEDIKIMLTKEQQELVDKIRKFQERLYCNSNDIFMIPDSQYKKFLEFFIEEQPDNCKDMCKKVNLPLPNFLCSYDLIWFSWTYDDLEPEEKRKWEEKAEKTDNETGWSIWLDEGDERKWYNEAIDKIYHGIDSYFDQLEEKYEYYSEDTYDELEEKLEETIFIFFETEKIKVSKRDIIKMIDDLELN